MAKKEFVGTPEEVAAYKQGIADERERLVKILKKYHDTFGSGDIETSTAMMRIEYMYNFIIETRSA
jgi:iron uptake system EfeUOB component EfeO/EfeM